MIIFHECENCGEEIGVDYAAQIKHVDCAHCGSAYSVDFDAEFIDGSWKDRTKIYERNH